MDPNYKILEKIDGKKYSLKQRESLITSIGEGSISAVTLINKIFPFLNESEKNDRRKPYKPEENLAAENDLGKYLIIGGEKSLPARRALCCNPKYGQSITGFITRGSAISIHRSDCRVFTSSNIQRWISAKWIGSS